MRDRDGRGADLRVSEVKIRLVPACAAPGAAGRDESENGLVGWASCVVNECLFLNNIAIRRGLSGEIVLTFPAKKSRRDVKYFYFKPITRDAKAAIDHAILGAMRELTGRTGAP